MKTTVSQPTRVNDLAEWLREGRILDAIEEFYSSEVTVEVPHDQNIKGKAQLISYKKRLLASVKQVLRFETARVVETPDNCAIIQSVFDFEDMAGKHVLMDEIAVQTWVSGKVIHEKVYRFEN